MVLTEAIKSKFESVLQMEAQKKQLEEDIKKVKADIQEFMYQNGELKIKQDGYSASIGEAVRTTLIRGEIEKLLGKTLPDSCVKKTPYITVTIKRMALV